MKKAKRALALALVFALVASFCVTGAAAEPGQGDIVYGSYDGNVWSQTADGDGSYTDERSGVTVSKTAEAVSGEDNQYEVTLKVEVPVTTSTKSASAATVLVIDVSNSMYYCDKCGANIWHKDDCGYNEHGSRYDDVEDSQTRLYAAKKAAKDFVDGYSDTENDTPRYVAIVIFGRYGYNVGQYWYDVSTDNGYEDAIDAIDGLNTPGDDIGGTNLDEGLSKAEELFTRSNYYGIIDDVPRKNRFAIALTDGRPTCSELRGDGTSCNQNILNDTQETADALKKEAKLYTVCFGAADEVCWEGSWYQEKGPTVGDFLENSIASSGCAYEASDGADLSNIFNQLTDEIKDSLKNLTVTDPMADGVTLNTDFRDDSVSFEDQTNTIKWSLNGGETSGNTITYTLTYTVTVDPAAFEDQKADYYPLNGETYLSIPAQDDGETESTVQFPVPGVFVTPTSTETRQDVYVYVKVVGAAGADGNLTQDELEQAHAWGLTTLNNSGWYTIGVVYNCLLPPIPDPYDTDENIYSEYSDAVDLGADSLIRFEDNKGFDITGVNWNDLHVADGADNYVESGTACWHLDGTITLDNLKDRLVKVTYTDGVDDEVVFDDQVYDRIPGTATPAFNGTPTRKGFTFNGWQSSINGQVYSADELADMTVPKGGVTYTATWTKNTSSITIEVYVDGTKVTLTDDNLDHYISELKEAEGTPTFTYVVESGVIKGTYNYQNYDSADIVLTPNGKYVLQGIKGTFIKGETAWTGITTPSGTAWNIDNVMGGTTLSVYLNTKYSVEYEVPSGFTEPEEDDNTYITVEGLQDVSEPSFEGVADGNEGREGGWTNNNLETTINLKTVPTGTTGWYNENNTQYTQTTLAVSDAAAANSGYDNNGDHIFTFTATANEYTVTYNANATGATGTTADNNTYTHGATVTVLENGFTYAGHTFTGWNTQQDGSGKAYQPNETFEIEENTILYAQWEEITGKLTVTKTVEGLEGNDTLPDAFAITVSGTSGAADGVSYTLTIGMSNGENIKYSYDEASGTHQWVISGAALGTYNVTEANYKVEGYLCEGDEDKTATITDANGEEVTLTNSYTLISRELSVVKTVIKVGETDVEEGAAIPAAKVGETIIYEIVVTNNSNVALENISVTDELVNSVLYSDEGCTVTASATIESLEADGGSATFYAKYKVTAADAEAGSVTNTATAKSGDTTGTGTEEVDVKKQYTLTINHYYDEVGGATVQASAVQTLNEGDSWTATPLTNVDKNGVNYIFDASLSTSPLSGTISGNVTVDLVYVKDEWKDDDPDGDSETGGDGTPDYRQALILYEVAEGQDDMGGVSPTIDVVTLTDDDGDGEYSGSVPAESTATPEDGSVFVEWSWTHDEDGPSTNATLSHEFTAVGGETYTYTASFRAGETDAKVTKTLDSYTRGDAEPTDIPEGFKARVGDVLNYTITVKNTGEVALNTTVTDSITGEGTLTINAGEGYTVEDGKIIISGLAPEGTVTITASYTVTAADAGKTITNTATADLPGDEPGDDPTGEEEVTVDEYGITVTPADITIYMGGDAGYEAVVGENGQVISDNNTLPTPLFTVELSESFGELSVEQIEAIEIAGTTSDAGTRGWRFDYAGKAEDGTDLYYIVPNAGQDLIRVTYTNTAGEEVVSDHFDPATIDELFAEFTIELYTGTVTSVTAEVKGITCEIDYSGTGTLTVRAVDDTDENPVVGVQVALPRPVEAGEGAVTAPAGTTYTLNETTVAADAAGVGLLFDGIIDDGADRTGALLAELESELGVTVEDGNYQAQYLDLVDAHNGNAWVKASGAVTVYWGYPEGTGEDTNFALYHFEGLHREGENSGFDIEDVATSDIERVQITKTANGIAFDIGSGGFSPFVLVWDDGDGGDKPWWPPIGPGDDDDDGDDGGDGEFVPKWLNIDDHYAYIIGYEDGTVRPQGNITRAEVATIFFRLLTDEVREEYWSTVSGYTDVKAGDWYNNAISTLSDLGIITGYEDGTFRPNASISRAEFVTIATRFFDYAAEYEGAFSDVSYSSWYADFVQAAVDMGLVNGYENGNFRPNASITRAEAVAIVNRVLLRRPDADHLLPWSVMNTFSDNVLESAWYYEDIQEATNSHDYEWLKSGVEDWTEKLPERDWAALEREWSKAYDAPGGEVTA